MSSNEERSLCETRKALRQFYATKNRVTVTDEKTISIPCELDSVLRQKSSDKRAIFKFQVCKHLLLSQFELILCSNELLSDPKWCKRALNRTFQLAESLNTVIKSTGCSHVITLADMCDTYVLTSGFVTSVTIATTDNTKLISEWVETAWQITVCVIVFIMCNTSVNVGQLISPDILLQTNDWSLDTSTLDENIMRFIGTIWGRVWQDTGRRLVPMVMGMGGDTEHRIEMLRKLMKGDACSKFAPLYDCLLYVVNSIDVRDQLNKCYLDSCQRNLELSSSMTQRSITPLSSYQKEYCTSIMSTVIKSAKISNTKENNSSSPVAIATETNRLLLVYPLLSATQSSLWTTDNKVIQRLQHCLSRNDLSGIVYLVFEVGVAMRQQRRTLGRHCEDVATSAFSLPLNSPQYWISRRNISSYSELRKGIMHIETTCNGLWELFLLQWRNKCRLLLDSVFPTSKMWKKLEKGKEVSNSSAYIVPIKEQLVLPLVSACDGLSSLAQRLTVFMTFSILLSEIWNCVQKRFKKGMSAGVCNAILRDCQYLQSLVASLHPDVNEIVYHLPVYTMIKNNWKKCIEVDENMCPILTETQTILKGIPPFITFLDNLYH